MKRQKGSLYRRFFAVFFLILLPLEVIGLGMYRSSSRMVSDELYGAAASNVAYLRSLYEENIESLRQQLNFLISQPQITRFMAEGLYLTRYDYYTEISNIQSNLYFAAHTFPFLQAIRLYYPRQGLCILSDKKIERFTQEEMQALIAAYDSQDSALWERGGSMLISGVYRPVRLSEGTLPPLYVEMIISQDAVRESLASYATYSAQRAYLVNHATGTVTASDQLGSQFLPEEPLMRMDSEEVYSFRTELGGESYLAVACYSRALDVSFVQLIPARRMSYIPETFRFWILLFMGFSVLGAAFFAFNMNRLVRRPTRDLIEAFRQVGEGRFGHTVQPAYLREYNLLARHFNTMSEQLRDLIQENYEQVIRLQRAEFKQLQSQINPHFLYNSFFMVRRMVQEGDTDSAMELLTHLGDYFKYVTRSARDEAHLQEECDHARHYLSIQAGRFDRSLRADFPPLPEEAVSLRVPRLILQPILENAIEHCPPSFARPLSIWVRFLPGADLLTIEVENDGTLTDDTLAALRASLAANDRPAAETTGLINISRRLRLFYHQAGDLAVERGASGGLLVRLSLPVDPSHQSAARRNA